ncbi:eukaryotic mitochondrial regulator protein-domain-containing protein [Cubamyces lactineus]|nr:eukaryotic mitochondrial regulator protein-domain-containing protein [Cubamyces lactineus]
MLAHLAQASRRPARSWLSIASSRRTYAIKASVDDGPTYAAWLRKEGVKYREPHKPKNWLGGEPFPLNRTFKPPTPLSDDVRTAIWREYMLDPVKYDVRRLAQRHGLSIARVDAILRLKGLEEHWKKGKQLQTGFLVGMEYILGVTEKQKSTHGLARASQELGEDAVEADAVSEATKSRARDRYQRLFWEPITEGKIPVTPTALSRASVDAVKISTAKEAAKLKRLRSLSVGAESERVVERPGRPTMRFVDVGAKFLDVDDRLRRISAAKRRSQMKRQRRARVGTVEASQQSETVEPAAASI